ncbi:hypothetical protein VK792_14715 [Mesobacterium sp. TK19101]|uniref:Uncharacterized protein n=1 Tax=Mesobacterium hydrothermale TaxID=3111907 RepID=A0ABU6HJA8_9RHOB|nr:hypothetical protein [Mesobacterium sp. TK19101]MEC3862543.1 hypothetical protein [Mesobacterium sp. TK19101]
MTASYTIYTHHNLVIVRYSGRITNAQMMRALIDYSSDPHFAPGQSQLIDLSEVHTFDIDFKGMMQVNTRKADLFNDTSAPVISVYIAPDETAFGMARMMQQLAESLPMLTTIIHRDETAALAELGLRDKRLMTFYARAP